MAMQPAFFPWRFTLSLLCLLILLPRAPVAAQTAPVSLGRLSTFDHLVAGEVFALSERVLEIRGFTYDGQGPAAFFWVGEGPTPNSGGDVAPFRDGSGCNAQPLQRYNGENVVIELPEGRTVRDIGYLSVWCARFTVDFGSLRILPDDAARAAPETGALQCGAGGGSGGAGGSGDSGSGGGSPPMQAQNAVPDGYNCEPLSPDFQVNWKVDGDELAVELVGRIDPLQYLGFGPSGSESRTQMVGSDVVIAYENAAGEFRVDDYFMSSRGQCSGGSGVCPDTIAATGPGSNDVTSVSGEKTGGLTIFRYRRPLAATDGSELDRPISVQRGDITFITWAIGPMDGPSDRPRFHNVSFPTSDVRIEFGRDVQNRCSAITGSDPEVQLEPWTRSVVSGAEEITARIGPSGGARGVTGATGNIGWGIAWYMNDVLIPTIGVERGKTYRFIVQGGNDPRRGAQYHPLYITDDQNGGFADKSPAARASENIYAGIEKTGMDENGGVTNFTVTAAGRLCQYTATDDTDGTVDTFEEYFNTLDRSCAADEALRQDAAVLEWTVAEDTPDIVYYQCVTHQGLGWKIRVFDQGQVNERELASLNVVGSEDATGGDGEAQSDCVTMFDDGPRTFAACRSIQGAPLRILWTANETTGQLETAFEAELGDSDGYVGFAYGTQVMVPADAVIAYRLPDGRAEINTYALMSRSSAGVQPDENNPPASNLEVYSNDRTLTGYFTLPLTSNLIQSSEDGESQGIWAIGPLPQSPTSLQRHSQRSSVQFNIFSTGPLGTPESTEEGGSEDATGGDGEVQSDCMTMFDDGPRTFAACRSIQGAPLRMLWTANEMTGQLTTAFEAELGDSDGYVGFAYGTQAMVPADAVIAYRLPDGRAEISTYALRGRSSAGVQPDANSLPGSNLEVYSNGRTLTGYFTLPLASNVLQRSNEDESQGIWAIGPLPQSPTSLQQHSLRNPVQFNIFSTGSLGVLGSTEEARPLLIAHGVMMAVSWVVLAPLAVLIARFLKSRDPLWFHLHRGMMLFTVVTVIVAYGFGLSEGNRTEMSHLIIGSIAMAGGVLQALGGILRPHKDARFRKEWRFGHAWWGRTMVVLAFINVVIGLTIYPTGMGARGLGRGYFIAVGVVFGLLLAAGAIREVMIMATKGRSRDEESVGDDNA